MSDAPDAGAGSTGSILRALWPAAALVLAVGVVFAPGLSGEFVWDDLALIVRNAHIRNPGHVIDVLIQGFWDTSAGTDIANPVYRNLYRPFVSLSYIAQFHFFGERTFGYHVVSLVLHALCAVLAWLFLRARLPEELRNITAAPFLGALVFALHPSRPESVSWISGSTDLWMMLWLLVGFLAWEKRPSPWSVPVTALSFAMALLCKETAIVAPLLLVADAWCGRYQPGDAKRIAVAVGAVAATMAMRMVLVPFRSVTALPQSSGDVMRALVTLGLYVREALSPWAPSTQIGTRHATVDGAPVFDTGDVMLGVLAAVTVVTLLVLVRTSVGKRLGPWTADLLWFVIPLAPVLNIVDLASYTYASDRFLYFPLLGLASVATRAVAMAVRRGPPMRGAVLAAAACLVVGFGVISFAHTTHFRSNTSLWVYEHELNPENLYVISELAMLAHGDENPEVAADLNWVGFVAAKADGNEWAAGTFALSWAQEIMSMTADADQATLVRVRDAMLALGDGPRFALRVGDREVDASLSPAAHRAMLASAKYYRVPRIISLLRTDALDVAARELQALLRKSGDATVWTLLVSVYGRQGRFDLANQALAQAEAAQPGHPSIARIAHTLRMAEKIAASPAADEVAATMREARIQLVLGSVTAARKRMVPLLAAHPDRWDVALATAEVAAGDRQYDDALRILKEAREPTGVAAATYDGTVTQLEAARARAKFLTKVW